LPEGLNHEVAQNLFMKIALPASAPSPVQHASVPKQVAAACSAVHGTLLRLALPTPVAVVTATTIVAIVAIPSPVVIAVPPAPAVVVVPAAAVVVVSATAVVVAVAVAVSAAPTIVVAVSAAPTIVVAVSTARRVAVCSGEVAEVLVFVAVTTPSAAASGVRVVDRPALLGRRRAPALWRLALEAGRLAGKDIGAAVSAPPVSIALHVAAAATAAAAAAAATVAAAAVTTVATTAAISTTTTTTIVATATTPVAAATAISVAHRLRPGQRDACLFKVGGGAPPKRQPRLCDRQLRKSNDLKYLK